jgi:hypothetical protein
MVMGEPDCVRPATEIRSGSLPGGMAIRIAPSTWCSTAPSRSSCPRHGSPRTRGATAFRREALAAAARPSSEPNTVTIFYVGERRGTRFIVTEYLGGGTLEQALRGSAQPPEGALAWIEQAAHSLDALTQTAPSP